MPKKGSSYRETKIFVPETAAETGASTNASKASPIAEIMKIATDAFDDGNKASKWMREPNIRFGYRAPLDLIGTPQGFQAVETVLGQIKYAIFA